MDASPIRTGAPHPFRMPPLIALLLGAGICGSSLLAHAQKNPLRDVFFGETHLHTSWSFDAYVFGNTLTGPEEAYQFAIGKPIRHPAGYMVQIKRPLDFQAVTDHSEYMGTIRLANDPQSDLSKLPIAEKLKVRSKEDVQKVYLFLATSIITEPIKELVSPDVVSSVWKRVVEAADKYYQPGKFTTFAAYEWSSTPDNRNLHRNILFKDAKKVPALPFSSIDSNHPEDLWAWMDGQRKAGNEVLAISHNANLSDGVMFPLEVDSKGRPIDAAWAQSRVNNEPLSEIQQLKGASETHPALSPNDEFARHEILEYLLGEVDRAPRLHGSYIREGYESGLAMQDTRGYNPYKFGLVGASDTHGTAAAYAQSNYFGGHGLLDATPQARISGVQTAGMTMDKLSTSGLGGVWAEENTREAIFAAMQRKETFGTSGVRIKVRFFGGWDFAPNVLQSKDWVKTGYANGVPMGGDLPAAKSKAPTFIVWAVKDPDDANLDRIQIVKGWTRNGQIFEKIYDVAWSNRKAKGGGPISDARVRSGQAELPPVGTYRRHQERVVHQHHRGSRAEDCVDRPGLRPRPIRFLLRTGAADPDAALDDVRREEARRPAAQQHPRDGSGSRVDFADLVLAERGSAQSREARHDGRRLAAKGRRGAGRRAAQAAHRRKDLQGPQHRDGAAHRNPVRAWTAGASFSASTESSRPRAEWATSCTAASSDRRRNTRFAAERS